MYIQYTNDGQVVKGGESVEGARWQGGQESVHQVQIVERSQAVERTRLDRLD